MSRSSIAGSLFRYGALLGLGLLLGLNLEKLDLAAGTESKAEPAEKKPLYWVAPMDKNYRRDEPGLSPMGMDLVPVYEEDASEDGAVKISPIVENNLGVKTAYVKNAILEQPVETIGTVRVDESRVTHIHSRVEGWIEKLYISAAGDPVRKGQVLFDIYSQELVTAQAEYLAAMRSRNPKLVKSAESRLRSLGVNSAQIKALAKRNKVKERLSIFADRDGFVMDLNVREGMYIKPSVEVMAIGSLDSVWVVSEIFERQAYLIEQGQGVELTSNAMAGRTWQGMVNYVYPELDAATRTLNVRVRVHNPDHALKPNMLANVRIAASDNEEVLTIPSTALIKTASHARVVKSLGEGRYQSVIVSAGASGVVEGENSVAITAGLSQGDLVVTSAQFMIDSESNIEAELLRMEEASQPEPPVAPTNKVTTAGSINQVMTMMGMVKITHEPIPEWDWPEMTMDFPIADSLSLDAFKEGETIRFELEKLGDWEFVITALGDDIGKTSDMPMMDHDRDAQMEHTMDHEMSDGDTP